MAGRLVKRPLVLDRDENGLFAIAAATASIYMLAYAGEFGKWPILCFYGIWFSILFANPQTAIAAPQRILPLLVLPAFATISFLWSTESALSLRHGIQFGTTVLAGIVMARIVSFTNMTKGMLLSTVFVVLYSLDVGEYSYDVIDGTYSFAGAFESKNTLGFMAALSIIPAICILVTRGYGKAWNVLALLSLPLSIFTLSIAQSTTAILISAAAAVTALLIKAGSSFAPMARRVLLVFTICVIAVGVYSLWTAGFFDKFLAILGKDATLTGRTYLWREALRAGAENPVFGLGYKAFWVHGQPEAERLWHEFYITARSGFHFHNTILETYVGLGLAGVIIVLAIMSATIFLVIQGVLGRMSAEHAMIFGAFSVAVLARSFIEVDFVTEYSVSTFLLTYFLVAAMDEQAFKRKQLKAYALNRMRSPKLAAQ